MRIHLVVFILLISSSIFSQKEVNIFTEREGSQVHIYADNPSLVPMTINLQLDLTNMKTDFGSDKGYFVIPPKSSRFKIVTASAIRNSGRTGLGLDSYVYLGDYKAKHDDTYVYYLPFGKGESYLISQGYNGRFSHQGENALDFALDVGEKVYAARGGVVYKVIESNKKSCRNSSCQKFNNYVTVYHSDGTFSEYSHLEYNGAEVNVGDEIEVGGFIGYSGNTGWSSGPHLHFVVYKYNMKGERVTIKTKFETSSRKGEILKENKRYTKT